jgi:amidase
MMPEPPDLFGAFVPGARCSVPASGRGTLDGIALAVKDLIAIEGAVTGGGNPHWAASHGPAALHAPAVAALLAAGAHVCGKTITDELAFSLEGHNWHYGTPVNPLLPDCLPGGSSSGSAVAVAAGLADIALGTDTGGSVRVPAAFCGIYGFRPTHGRVSLEGVLPFAPSYDTVGWFARSAALLADAGRVLLDSAQAPTPIRRLCLATDVHAMTEPRSASLLRSAAEALGVGASVDVFAGRAPQWQVCYQVLQGAEIRQTLGDWIAACKPLFGPDIAPRFASVMDITDDDIRAQQALRTDISKRLHALLQDGTVLVMPTVPVPALKKTASRAAIDAFYEASLAINGIAGHAGLPQLVLPVGQVDGKPASLSFIAARGMDEALLAEAARWAAVLKVEGFGGAIQG